MTKKTKVTKLPEFDLSDHIKNADDVAAYLTMVIEDGDSAELAHALGLVARSRGMTEVAKASGVTREALYRALRPNSLPRFDTINRVCTALGVKLVVLAADK